MILKTIGVNQAEAEYSDRVTFYSYSAPVVVVLNLIGEVYVTNEFHSVATRRHIKKYLKQFGIEIRVRVVDQDKLNDIAIGK